MNASGALRMVLAYDDVRVMLETSADDQLLRRGGSGPNEGLVNGLINSELEDRKRYFGSVLSDLRQVEAEAERLPKRASISVLVPDTNIYLHTAKSFPNVDWADVVDSHDDVLVLAPMVVLREIDYSKRAPGSKRVDVDDTKSELVRDRARRSAREISRIMATPHSTPRLPGSKLVTFGLLLDPVGHVPIDHADTEFIDRVALLQSLTDRKVAIFTADNGMRSSAMVARLEVVQMDDGTDEYS